ncbi:MULTISPECIES: peptidylprolyl isomerase SurA [Gammaproteobacteria]|uniref:peptidylprolyl isomerase SurA n=1 Tax=Gammaproteobacteria TaxID=1236 RepID=UPI000DCF8CB6|nr:MULTISPECIES: peptidylprolyl isomerase SurA [Gammaproteobacteria]RTE85622.1 peptidylprolyl isomerase SurA [Aliidiomarina sp. B3213]TCZ89591.1 peptidylprolyl isomerase SurA [Lysobacter sp. N42]
MKQFKVMIASLILAFSVTSTPSNAQMSDRIAIVVDNGVVLESEVQDMMGKVRSELQASSRSLPSSSALRTQVTERLIAEALQLQMAERMGLVINDAQLDQAITGIAGENNLTLDQMRTQIEREGQSWRAYREDIRKQIVIQEVQRIAIQRRIYMSPQEVDMLVNMIKEQGGSQTEYNIGHILIRTQDENGEQDMNASLARAEQVLELLEAGEPFEDIAISASSASNALEGGDMGWLTLNAMPTLFAEAVEANNQPGAVLGPLRSGVGYHILKVHDVRGLQQAQVEEVRSRHILIRPSVILSEERVQQMLSEFKQQLESGEADFAELAREHSSDTGSAQNGGDLGFADPSVFVPEFRDRIQSMEIGVISEPFRSTHGWHIVEVLERRTQDITEQRIRERAQQLLYRRKFSEELNIWLQEIRDEAYVEFVTE